MTARRMCELGHVSRASLYRFAPEAVHVDRDLDLRDEIHSQSPVAVPDYNWYYHGLALLVSFDGPERFPFETEI